MSDTLEQLLDAAEISIRKKGYNAVSFRELADELGIKSASVHYYFPKKENLGLALVDRYSTRFFDALGSRLDADDTAIDRFDHFCATYRAALTNSQSICLCGMLGAESCGLPDPVSKAVARFFEDNIVWISKAMPEDWLLAKREARATQIVATLQGAMMLANNLGDHNLFDECVSHLRNDLFGD